MNNETALDKKLGKLYKFLEKNQRYNKAFQRRFYKDSLSACETKKEKALSLMYDTLNTQARPNIDRISGFFQGIYGHKFSSFQSFTKAIDAAPSYQGVFKALKNERQPGWGQKTSALFCKHVYRVHSDAMLEDYRFWNDAPIDLDNEGLYLPVDVVIETIFEKLGTEQKDRTFDKINEILHTMYEPEQTIIWDDLWFWGFFTQKGAGKKRELKWNEDKYWASKFSDKRPGQITEIKKKANAFLKLL